MSRSSRRSPKNAPQGPPKAAAPTAASEQHVLSGRSGPNSLSSSTSALSVGLAVVAVLSTIVLLAVYFLLPPANKAEPIARVNEEAAAKAPSAPQAIDATPSLSNTGNATPANTVQPPTTATPIPSTPNTAAITLPTEPIKADTEPQQKLLLEAVEKAVERFPNGADVLHVAGLTYGELLQTERAAELFRRSLEVDPRNLDVLIAYSDMLTKVGKHSDAIVALEKGIENNLDSASLRTSLGNAYMQVGESEKAATLLEQGVERDPNHAPLRLALSQAQLQLEQFSQAESNARRAIELGVKSRAAYVALTAALVRLDKRDEATELRKQMPPLEPSSIDDERYQESFREFASHTYGLLGLAFQNRGLTSDAEQWLLRSLEYNPASSKSLAALADICHRSTRLADALQIYQRLLKVDPQNLINYSNSASIALQLGNVPLAESSLLQATLVDESGYADLYLARFQFELGKYVDAARHASVAAQRSNDIEAYLVLIAAQQALGKPAQAFEALRKAREVAPNDPRLLNLQL